MTRVHAGSLARWFEQLCRIQVQMLREVAKPNGHALSPGKLPAAGGVYCFWWTGPLRELRAADCCRRLTLVGPARRPVDVEFDDEWLGTAAEAPIPLYVGKTADKIANRVGLHLMLKSARALATFTGTTKQKRPTTSCQLRAGIDQLFPQRADTRSTLLDNVGLSFVRLDGNAHAVNRFYVEDLAIGMMRPPLNIDVER